MQKPFHLLERVEHVVGGGGPPAYLRIVGTADEDADASRCQSFEGVLVRYVVAQVHRHHVVAVKVERAEQIQDGLPLVPVDVRLYLVDHLAWRHLQLVGVFGEDLLDGPSHLWPLILRNEPVVGSYGRLLRLDEGAIDLAQLLAQARLHPFEQPPEAFAFLALDLTAHGAPDVEAVAAGDDQVVYAHELLDYPPVAPADYAHGATSGQVANGVPHALRDERVLGPVDDRRQRAVVVEEHGRSSSRQITGQLITVLERVRQITNVPGHRLPPFHATRLEGPSTYSPSSARASAAAPSTPDSGPRVASFISTRSREGERALSCTSSRAGPRISSPAREAPPPMGITSGLKMFTKAARPMPSHRPVTSRTEMAASSPSWASLVTSSPSTCRSMASCPSAERGFSLATSRALRPMAVPEASASRQPRLPQPQRGPVGSRVTCPSSPPAPWAPLRSTPWVMTPPPTPVPRVMKTWWSTSLPAPKRNSPQAAALASFSTVTDRPVLGPSSSSRRMFSISCRLGAKMTLFSAARMSPGTATHTPPTSKPSFTSEIARAMVSINRFGGTAWVGYLNSFRILPSGETTAAAIFVPPTSTPMAFIPYLLVPPELLLRPFGAARHPNEHRGAALQPPLSAHLLLRVDPSYSCLDRRALLRLTLDDSLPPQS